MFQPCVRTSVIKLINYNFLHCYLRALKRNNLGQGRNWKFLAIADMQADISEDF